MVEEKKTVTSKDVAKLAGVSQSTVSRVFMADSSSSSESRKKVLEAASQLNYRPNAFARSLITRESKLIGLVFPDVDYPVHMETLQLLSRELKNKGYSAVLIPWQVDDNLHTISNIFQYRVDGVIAASAQFNTLFYDECKMFNIPVVQFARVQDSTQFTSVTVDNYGAGQEAASHLLDRGARSLAYLTGHIPSYTNTERERGFVDSVMSRTGRRPEVICGSYNYKEAVDRVRTLMNGSHRPDAVFCATDILAIALLDVAKHEQHLNIPQELQVIGFDDIPQASWMSYQLTTFRQDFSRLARESVRVLLDQISGQSNATTRLMIPASLVERRTTCRRGCVL
ncbi:LacI family transcriptional regulator [Endozoicomonas sp. (ex Bugula neritina AB1)]|nr:LacI family transcriptional regulator [Endozoicomonas sp. (ex Bugula neritina AB1)]